MSINIDFNKTSIVLICLYWLTACHNQSGTKTEHQLFVFGTLVNLTIWHDDDKATEHAFDEISHLFNDMHHQWHAWKPGRLTSINQQLRAGKSVSLNDEEAAFISSTIRLSEQSDGLFNPVMGELIHVWGFHTDDYPLLTPPPEQAEIDFLVGQQLNTSRLQLNGNKLSAGSPHVWLDFGGIAKGYAVDRAIEVLRRHGIDNAIVNAGGDLRSIGRKGNQPWRIAIQSPADWQPVAELTVSGDEAIFTSGNYQRYKAFDGQRYAHIIHPDTGQPVAEVVSATVITEQGIKADAVATALVVAGSENWYKVAQKMGIELALVIDDQNRCLCTSAMLDRLENLTVDCVTVNQL